MSGDSKWGTTNQVYYCEVHDSLVRKTRVDEHDDSQCDSALMQHIPSWYESCTVEIWTLTKIVLPDDGYSWMEEEVKL